MCLCVLCGSENKQRLFPHTALTDWFSKPRLNIYCAVRAVFSRTVEAGFILQNVSMEAADRRFVAPDRSLSYPTLAYANSRVFTVQQFQQG